MRNFYSVTALVISYPAGSVEEMPPPEAFNDYEELEFRAVEIKRFPVLHLMAGSVQEIDDRTSYTFPTYYTESGTNALNEKTYQIGDYFHVSLDMDSYGSPTMDVRYEGAKLERWEEHVTSYGYKYRFPLVKRKEMHAKLRVDSGRWYEVGRIFHGRGMEGQLVMIHFAAPASDTWR